MTTFNSIKHRENMLTVSIIMKNATSTSIDGRGKCLMEFLGMRQVTSDFHRSMSSGLRAGTCCTASQTWRWHCSWKYFSSMQEPQVATAVVERTIKLHESNEEKITTVENFRRWVLLPVKEIVSF